MNWPRFWKRKQRDKELAAELEEHLRHETEDNLAAGMSRDEARLAAKRKLGNATRVREAVYEMNALSIVESLGSDLRHGLRSFRRNPGFTSVALLSLALGIGANTAIFQVLNAVCLRSLPVSNPQELVEIRVEGDGRMGDFRGRNSQFSYPLWAEIRDRQQALSGLLAWGDLTVNLSPDGEVRNVEGLWVSGSFFPSLGVRPMLGRLFTPLDDRPGCGNPGVVISHAFWQREFGGGAVLGKTLPMMGRSVAVIGVTAPEFFGVEVGRRFDVALPLCFAEENFNDRSLWWLAILGRLNPDWPLEQARAHLASLSPTVFEAALPNYSPDDQQKFRRLRLDLAASPSGVSALRAAYEQPLWLLMSLVGFVLLIACVNIANMMLGRAAAREQEFAVRLSLGASRARVVRQLLTECLLLAGLGGVMAILAAPLLSRSIILLLSTPREPIFLDVGTDWRVLAFTAALVCLTCVLFGLTPAFRAGRTLPTLRTGSRSSSVSREKATLRRLLVVTQIALCLVLLSGALLFVGSLRNLKATDVGFRQDAMLVANTILRSSRYPVERRHLARQEMLERLRAIPGAGGVAYSYNVPISGSTWDRGVRVDGAGGEQSGWTWLNSVSAGYFEVVETRLLAGRDFQHTDTPTSPKVAIVNEAFGRQYFGQESPVGNTFRMPAPAGRPEEVYEVVGLVENSKYSSIREPFSPIAFLAAAQEEQPRLTVRYVLRSEGSAESLVGPVKRVLLGADPELTIRFAVLETQIEESIVQERLMAALSGFFGILAGALAVVGLYGVVSFMVVRRQSEIGVRIALGAGRWKIFGMILGEVGLLLAVGLGAGLALTLWAGKAAQAMLFGVQPHDPPTLAGAIAILAGIGLLAAFLPARRAANIEPMQVLRDQ